MRKRTLELRHALVARVKRTLAASTTVTIRVASLGGRLRLYFSATCTGRLMMKRLVALQFWLALFAIGSAWFALDVPATEAISPGRLRCEMEVNPLGVDALPPRLYWIVDGNARGDRQTAYQVLVASSAERLSDDGGDLWDSGRVESDETIHIPYAGQPLLSSQQVFWKVRLWDKG